MAIGYVDDTKLTAVADAIRAKKGTTEQMTLDQMPGEIGGISSGSTEELNCNLDFSKYSINNPVAPKWATFVDLSTFPVGLTNLSYLFSRSLNSPILEIRNYENIDTSSATKMTYVFESGNYKDTLDLTNWDTSNVTNMGNMFRTCKSSVKLGNKFSIRKVTDMSNMFVRFEGEIVGLSDVFTDSVVTSMAYIFQGSVLKQILLPNFKTPNLGTIASAFDGCSKLTTVDISNLVTTNVTSASSCFADCYALETVKWGNNWLPDSSITSFDLSSCTKLSHDSILDLFNKLATRTNSPTLSLASTAKARMSAEEIKIATDKGWTVA